MSLSLPGPLRGAIIFSMLLLNTFFWMFPVYAAAILKLLLPFRGIRTFFDLGLNWMCHAWMYCNNEFIIGLFKDVEYDVQGLDALKPDEWYLVIANHQTWVDIIVLHKVMHGRIPFIKYFLKRELIWLPILGLVWWALDYPFMKRYSPELIKRKPHLKGKDIQATRKACEKFKDTPASIMNFVEGTRFTPEKHASQGSPYKYLLKPRSGGITFVFSAMGEYINKAIDITIFYPEGVQGLWGFLCSKRSRIAVRINVRTVEESLKSGNPDDTEYRARCSSWINSIWEDKDSEIDRLRKEYSK